MRRAWVRDRDLAALLWLDLTIVIMAAGLLATIYPYMIPDTWTVDQPPRAGRFRRGPSSSRSPGFFRSC